MVKHIESGQISCFFKTNITPKQICQLILHSKKDKEIKKFTSDPKRFLNYEAFQKWRAQGRIIYTLTDKEKEGNLLGIIWFGKKELPERKFIKPFKIGKYSFTFAVRIYEQARGKGFSKEFMGTAFDEFMAKDIYKDSKSKGFWLEISNDNLPAINSYLRFGFSQVTKPDTNNKIIMLYNSKYSK